MGKIHSIQQITENTHLNFYSMEVEDRKGKTFPYYMASRAKTQAELKMNSGQGPDHPDGVVIYSLYGEKKTGLCWCGSIVIRWGAIFMSSLRDWWNRARIFTEQVFGS